MWIKICEALLVVLWITSTAFAWPTRSQLHDLEYGQWHHSIALTALGLGLFLAVLAIQSLRKQLEALQARDRAANTHKAPFCQERKNDHQVTPSSDLVCLVAKDNDGGEGAGPQL